MAKNRNYWLVGALIDDVNEINSLLKEGRWTQNKKDKLVRDKVKKMRPGDKIAIKATFWQQDNLPFTLPGHVTIRNVAVMRIKATGTIRKNPGNGLSVTVQWDRKPDPTDWYFFTYQPAVWKLTRTSWRHEALIDFVFNNEDQEFGRFIEFYHPHPDD